MDESPTLKEFDMAEELGNWRNDSMPAIGIMGIRNSGKSKLAIAIIRYMAHRFANAILICPTHAPQNKIFGDIFAKPFIHKNPTIELLQQIIVRQNGILDNPDSTASDYEKNLLLVMDDVGSYADIMKSEPMNQILANGRQLRITIIITAQYFNQLNTQVRTNIIYLFALQETSLSILKKLNVEFFPFPNVREFKEAMDEFTSDYGYMVAKKMQGKTSSITERVFYGKALPEDILLNFSVGNQFYWLIDQFMCLTLEEQRQLRLQAANQPIDFSGAAPKAKFVRVPVKKKSNATINKMSSSYSAPASLLPPPSLSSAPNFPPHVYSIYGAAGNARHGGGMGGGGEEGLSARLGSSNNNNMHQSQREGYVPPSSYPQNSIGIIRRI